MSFEGLQYVAAPAVILYGLLFAFSHAHRRKMVQAKIAALASRCERAIRHHLPQGPQLVPHETCEEVRGHLSDELIKWKLHFLDQHTLPLIISHMMFMVFLSHAVACSMVFVASGAGMEHRHICYYFGAIFALAYVLSAVVVLIVGETYNLLLSFTTGGDLMRAGGGEDD